LSVAIVRVLPEIVLMVPSWLAAAGAAAVAGAWAPALHMVPLAAKKTIPALSAILQVSELFRVAISVLF
jgi:hypothetical protein